MEPSSQRRPFAAVPAIPSSLKSGRLATTAAGPVALLVPCGERSQPPKRTGPTSARRHFGPELSRRRCRGSDPVLLAYRVNAWGLNRTSYRGLQDQLGVSARRAGVRCVPR